MEESQNGNDRAQYGARVLDRLSETLACLIRYVIGDQAILKVVPDGWNGGFHFTGQ